MSPAGSLISRRDLLRQRLPGPAVAEGHWIRVHRQAMACRFEVTLSDQDEPAVAAARAALDEADRVEACLTVFRPTSAIMEVNRNAADRSVAVDQELFDLLQVCAGLSSRTRGAFDITSTPLSRAWGFLARDAQVPEPAAIETARALVGMDGVELDSVHRTVRFRRTGMELNLGGIGKGYALGCMAAVLRRHDVRHALLSAGGSSAVAVGGRGAGWPVDLRSARFADRPLARLWLREGALSTTGAGEQFVELNGTRYGHVLDPRSGWPAPAGLVSASCITSDPAVAEALSTAFFVSGLEFAREFCAAHEGTLAILTPDNGSGMPHVFGSHDAARVEVE